VPRIPAPPAPSPLARCVEDYLTSCRARGLSPKTLENGYGYPLRHGFLPWAAREGPAAPSDMSGRALEKLAAELLGEGGRRGPLSRRSVHTYLQTVNQCLKWARAEGEAVPERAVAPLPSRPKNFPEVLSREQIAAMEAAAATERDRLIIRLLADTGMRVGELVALGTGDLRQRSRGSYLRLSGKGPGAPGAADAEALQSAAALCDPLPAGRRRHCPSLRQLAPESQYRRLRAPHPFGGAATGPGTGPAGGSAPAGLPAPLPPQLRDLGSGPGDERIAAAIPFRSGSQVSRAHTGTQAPARSTGWTPAGAVVSLERAGGG